MKSLCLYLSILFLLFNCTSQNTEQIIKLNQIPIDSVSIDKNFSSYHARPIKNNNFEEKIKKYAPNFEVEAVYQLANLQRSCKLAEYILNNPEEKERYLKEFGTKELEFLKQIKKFYPFDCTVSTCIVKDKKGKEYFIFDTNNDEDFTNDPLLNFQKSFTIQRGDTLQILKVHGNAQIEYFDGYKVRTKNIGLIFERKPTNFGVREYWMFDSILTGTIVLSGKEYPLVLTHPTPNFDYYKFDFIGIDLNRNSKFEPLTDYFQQMYLPFTFENTSYKIMDIDRWGNHIKIKKCDPKEVPPIDVGLPAPDFTAITMDSTQIHLRDFKGHYVLLGFWSCNSQYCISQIGEMLEYANKGLRIINFTFLKNFDRFLSDDNKKTAKNLTIVATDVLNPIRKLYQIGSENATILIDKQGKIVLIEKFTYNKINQKLKEIFH